MTAVPSHNIPFFASEREFAKYEAEFMSKIKNSVSNGQFLQGKEVSELEHTVAVLSGRKYGVAVGSCTDALYFSLVAAGVQPGDEVLVTDFSFIASASCILRLGAKPVFVDIESHYLTDLSKAELVLSPKTKALIYVHLYGQMGDPQAVESFCKKHNLILIEDTAQAIGAQWEDVPAGSLGLASCMSFDPTKPISAPGSGGLVLTNEEKVAEKIRRLRYHGRGAQRSFEELGFNSQMPTLTAAVLMAKLKYNKEWMEKRRAIAQQYNALLNGIPHLVLPQEIKPGSHIYHKYVIQLDERDKCKTNLTYNGIESFVHYNRPLHQNPCFALFGYSDADYPEAVKASKRVLSLPIHPFLKPDEIERVVTATKEIFQK